MLSVKNNVITLNKTRQLSPKQLARMSRMSEEQQSRYLLSLMGLVKKSRVIGAKIEAPGAPDRLANKRTGSVLTQLSQMRRITSAHHPADKDLGKWIGVEIECYVPRDRVEHDYCDDCDSHTCGCNGDVSQNAHDYVREVIKRAKVSRCNVKDDGSLSDDDGIGVEVTLLFNSAYGFGELEKLCAALNNADCYVNDSCGLHVHLDVRHLGKSDAKRMGQSIGHALPVLKYIVADSRHDNEFCQLAVSDIRPNSRRYFAVNLTSYKKFGTIEIRLHQGTTNFKKIKSWIEVLQFLAKAKLKNDVTTFQDFIDLGLPEHLIEYADKRISKLHGSKAWAALMPVEIVATPAPTPVVVEPEPTVAVPVEPAPPPQTLSAWVVEQTRNDNENLYYIVEESAYRGRVFWRSPGAGVTENISQARPYSVSEILNDEFFRSVWHRNIFSLQRVEANTTQAAAGQ